MEVFERQNQPKTNPLEPESESEGDKTGQDYSEIPESEQPESEVPMS